MKYKDFNFTELTPSKNTRNIQNKKTKGFGYQILGFGAGQSGPADLFVVATGGSITTDGDFKVHTFTSPGTFEVTDAGGDPGANSVEFVIASLAYIPSAKF